MRQDKPNIEIQLPDLISKVCNNFDLTLDELFGSGKDRQVSHARAILALLVKETNHLSLENLGKTLQKHPSGLSKLAHRLELKSRNSDKIKSEVNELKIWMTQMSGCQA